MKARPIFNVFRQGEATSEIRIVTSFEPWSLRASVAGNDARGWTPARAHRLDRVLDIPGSFRCASSLDPAELKQVCALCREAFRRLFESSVAPLRRHIIHGTEDIGWGPDGRRNLMRLLKLGFSGNLLERLGNPRRVRRNVDLRLVTSIIAVVALISQIVRIARPNSLVHDEIEIAI
jgi:hypothetical protein